MAIRVVTVLLTVDTGTGSGTVVGSAINSLGHGDYFMVDAHLNNTDTGTVDVYVQRKVTYSQGSNTYSLWRDWCHFPQLAASVGARNYSVPSTPSAAIYAVGTGTDGTYASCATPALAANSFVGGHPGDSARLVVVQGGGGPFVAQTQTVYVTSWQDNT